jgi:hypothetical protein
MYSTTWQGCHTDTNVANFNISNSSRPTLKSIHGRSA